MKKIKVIHITTIDVGGAYKAVERILKATSQYDNIESNILLRNKIDAKNLGDEFLDSGIKTLISKTKNLANEILFHKGELLVDRLGSDVSKNRFVVESDIIVIHWINSFLSLKSIESLLKLKKPVIIMLHDMWHITGGCSYSGECIGYLNNCSECNKILANKLFISKQKIYASSNLTIVAPGTWIGNCASDCGLGLKDKVKIIPNCIDTDMFSPVDKLSARELVLGNSKIEKPIVLFTAMTAGKSNARKGFDYLKKALRTFKENSICLLIIGDIDEESLEGINQDKNYLGFVSDEKQLALAYSAADVTVVPSLQETFCYTACESLACGTPVTAFKVGGLLDQIIHKENGYLAKVKDSDDLAKGISYCIDCGDELQDACRRKAMEFGLANIGNMWKRLYEDITDV